MDGFAVTTEGGGPVEEVDPVEPVGDGAGMRGTHEPVTVGVGTEAAVGVGVVGVPGGVWLGVEGVDEVAVDVDVITGAWLHDKAETGGIAVVRASPPSMSFFTNSARSTSCKDKICFNT